MIIKCNWVIPSRFDAITIGNVIFIRNKCINDIPLVKHEEMHVKQFKQYPFTFWFKYVFFKKYRFQFEAEAYAEQIKFLDKNNVENNIHYFSNKLFTSYKLNYTLLECYNKIKQEYLK